MSPKLYYLQFSLDDNKDVVVEHIFHDDEKSSVLVLDAIAIMKGFEKYHSGPDDEGNPTGENPLSCIDGLVKELSELEPWKKAAGRLCLDLSDGMRIYIIVTVAALIQSNQGEYRFNWQEGKRSADQLGLKISDDFFVSAANSDRNCLVVVTDVGKKVYPTMKISFAFQSDHGVKMGTEVYELPIKILGEFMCCEIDDRGDVFFVPGDSLGTTEVGKNGVTYVTMESSGHPHTKTNFETYELPNYFSAEDCASVGPKMMRAYSLPITSVMEALGSIKANALQKSENTTTKKRKANSLYYAEMHAMVTTLIENITESQE